MTTQDPGAPPYDELVHVEIAGGVATLTLDSPVNRNALSGALVAQLVLALEVLGDRAVRVVVLTGAGPVFCSGVDLKEQRRTGGAGLVALPEVLGTLMSSPKPVVARVNGPARAGGVGLLAACDIAIGLRSATFAFSEVRLGLVPALISVPVLRRLDRRAAREYLLTGETFDGQVATGMGLLDRAVEADALDAEVDRYVDMLIRGGPESLRLTKQLLADVPAMDVPAALVAMSALSAERFASEEGQEGIAAFAARRAASWVHAGNRAQPEAFSPERPPG